MAAGFSGTFVYRWHMVKARSKKRGILITFEGVDGCGKSTQLRLTASFLRENGIDPVCLREPGTTKTGERIREILLHNGSSVSKITELLLYEAARAELVAREIKPQLNKGRVVLCDRFYDSTTAYQGFGKQISVDDVLILNRIATSSTRPDLTLIYDLPPPLIESRLAAHQIGLPLDTGAETRRALRDVGPSPDRLESRSAIFFQKVVKGFRHIAHTEPDRAVLIDARPSIEKVFVQTKEHVSKLLSL